MDHDKLPTSGNLNWLFGFQPSELAKITLIVCFSYWIARDTKGIRSFKEGMNNIEKEIENPDQEKK